MDIPTLRKQVSYSSAPRQEALGIRTSLISQPHLPGASRNVHASHARGAWEGRRSTPPPATLRTFEKYYGSVMTTMSLGTEPRPSRPPNQQRMTAWCRTSRGGDPRRERRPAWRPERSESLKSLPHQANSARREVGGPSGPERKEGSRPKHPEPLEAEQKGVSSERPAAFGQISCSSQ